ncbi:MAG: TIM barrel protein [Rhodovibrionaceae bacterium]
MPDRPRRSFEAWPLSLSYYTVPELDAVEAVQVAADCGCAHIGLRLLGGQPGGSEMPLMTQPELRRELKTAMRERQISALDANTARLIPESDVAAFAPFLDVAAELGAKHVLTTLDDPDDNRALDNFTALCEAAAGRSLTIDVEFVPWLSVHDLVSAAALLRRCGHPAAGIALDALHFYRSGGSLEDLVTLPLEWFRYLQLCDAPRLEAAPSRDALIHEAVKERLLPGEGAIDLAGLLRAFPAPLPLALEVPQTELSARLDARGRVLRAARATQAVLEGI